MINVKVNISVHDAQEAAIELEHISQLIHQGFPSGDGWEISGEVEKEPEIQLEDETGPISPEELADLI